MIILVEGVDKTGKTTLSKELARITGFEYRKHSTMHSSLDALNASVNVLLGISTNKNYVFDRFYFPSDLIYGTIVGKYDHSDFVTQTYNNIIIPILQEHGVIFVHCTASDSILAERFIRDEEEYATVEQITAIAEKYRDFADHGPFKGITLDSTHNSPDLLLRDAMLYIKGEMKL